MCDFDDKFEMCRDKALLEVLLNIRALILGTGRHHSSFDYRLSSFAPDSAGWNRKVDARKPVWPFIRAFRV